MHGPLCAASCEGKQSFDYKLPVTANDSINQLHVKRCEQVFVVASHLKICIKLAERGMGGCCMQQRAMEVDK